MWITISIVVFFTILIFISFYSNRFGSHFSRNKKWPPVINKCPDYWELEKNDDDKSSCVPKTNDDGNFINLLPVNANAENCKIIDPYLDIGNNSIKKQKKRILSSKCKDCGIVWDGIYNRYKN